MNAQTNAALNQAYEVFAHYEDSYGFARHSGVSRSLRELTRDDWGKMQASFDMEVLLCEDSLLRHFLPRILEWIIEDFPSGERFGSLGWIDLSYRLNHANWLEWPAAEVEALRGIFEAWARELGTEPEAQMPLDFLIDIKEDLTHYLDIWLEARPHEVAEWLWTINWNQNEKVWRWAITPHVEEALEAEFFRHPKGERAQLLSRSIELIRSLRG